MVAVKLGARGAIARRGSQIAQADSIPVKVVDTTGAGDSFDAGFVYAYLAGHDLPQALRFACACGSLSTRAAGGTARRQRWLKRWPRCGCDALERGSHFNRSPACYGLPAAVSEYNCVDAPRHGRDLNVERIHSRAGARARG